MYFVQNIPEIIKAASTNVLGVIALVIILVAIIAIKFFSQATERTKLLTFILVIVFLGILTYLGIVSYSEILRNEPIKIDTSQNKQKVVNSVPSVKLDSLGKGSGRSDSTKSGSNIIEVRKKDLLKHNNEEINRVETKKVDEVIFNKSTIKFKETVPIMDGRMTVKLDFVETNPENGRHIVLLVNFTAENKIFTPSVYETVTGIVEYRNYKYVFVLYSLEAMKAEISIFRQTIK